MNSFAQAFLSFSVFTFALGGIGMEILPRTDRDGGEERKNSAELECRLDQMEKRDNRFRTIIGRSIGRKVVSHLRGPGRWLEVHSLPDKDTGELLWKRKSRIPGRSGSPDEHLGHPNPRHRRKQSGGLLWSGRSALLRFGGKETLGADLGDFPGAGEWRIPVIVDGLVLQNCDSMGPSRLVATDLNSGKIAWETKRNQAAWGWSTPIVISVQGERQIVLNGEFGARGYSLPMEKNWFCQSFNRRAHPFLSTTAN